MVQYPAQHGLTAAGTESPATRWSTVGSAFGPRAVAGSLPGRYSNASGTSFNIDLAAHAPSPAGLPMPDLVLKPRLPIDVDLSAIRRVVGVPEASAIGLGSILMAAVGWRHRLWFAMLALRTLAMMRFVLFIMLRAFIT